MNTINVPDIFGSLVFNDTVMQKRLPKETYVSLKQTINEGRHLALGVANIVANAMKDWATELGATHFTHWFQPMTGITAEKHDSFISPKADGKIIMEFSGKELVKGEPDASSLPSGGLRATFEARGYTAWDPTSYAFIKGKTLCIPTAFCSYDGKALDTKTPLLRSMEALDKQAMRIIKLFGQTGVKCVKPAVGPEQEYFLIDSDMFEKRKDLKYTGRTLFGARSPKGQELDDHYFGAIKPKVASYMEELNIELWKLGIFAKTEHNETSPAQHELAPIYTTLNIATDHNQLTMEVMQKVARKHGLVCLLHEKPFAGVNGSGKHNNWSLETDTGENLLKPGKTPHEDARFLLFICAVVQAVDDYQDLLRLSVASAGNDHRLGANEAPPAVVSIFLGDELTKILEAIENDTPYLAAEKTLLRLGVHVLPRLPQDSTDRNRTSPFAFTGNKFEFRMLGSSSSIASANIMLNTAVAESLSQYADRLEGCKSKGEFNEKLHTLTRETLRIHKRIIFDGNGYDGRWVEESAGIRGLLNLKTTPDCIPYLISDKNVSLLTKHGVYSKEELFSRYEILLDNYCKVKNIEALTMIDMVRKDILPGIGLYIKELLEIASLRKNVLPEVKGGYEEKLAGRISSLTYEIDKRTANLEKCLFKTKEAPDTLAASHAYKDVVIPAMDKLREAVDEAETITAAKYWPFPSYGDLLFGVR